MKHPGKNLTRLVVAASATGVIIPSCTYNESEIVQAGDLSPKGLYAIELDLTKDEIDYIQFIQKLSNDIIKYPVVAKEFSQNPQLFLEKYGYNKSINLDDNIMKLVLSLGDDDINKSINAGDIKTVLSLMKEKNLLNDLSGTSSYINISEEKMNEIFEKMGVDPESIPDYLQAQSAGFFAAVAVLYIAAVFSLVGAWVVNYAWIETLSANKGADFIDKNSSLKIWALKDNPANMYIAADLYIEDHVNQIIDVLKSHNINYDENKMREFLKLNMLM